jgi:hypothetical protein
MTYSIHSVLFLKRRWLPANAGLETAGIVDNEALFIV